jgi:phosphoglycerate dehydrogenase-like enzyme
MHVAGESVGHGSVSELTAALAEAAGSFYALAAIPNGPEGLETRRQARNSPVLASSAIDKVKKALFLMKYGCAILDDYQNVALSMADWSKVGNDIEINVFNEHLGAPDKVIAALQGFAIVCAMRERTAFPRSVIEALPDLKLLVTTGMRNASIDLEAAKAHGVIVCGTPAFGNATAAIATGLMLELARHIGYENARLKGGAPWQTTIGLDLEGLTLALLGLGKLGIRMAEIGRAFKMDVIAWSENLTAETCKQAGVEHVGRDDLFRRADFLSIHVQLSQRTRGLIGARELGLMKPSAFLINTSRGPIVDEAALIAALRAKRVGGAGLDVFDIEPLPIEHPLRKLDNVVLTPHLGYVSVQNYRTFFAGVVEDIRGFLDGKPVRVLA